MVADVRREVEAGDIFREFIAHFHQKERLLSINDKVQLVLCAKGDASIFAIRGGAHDHHHLARGERMNNRVANAPPRRNAAYERVHTSMFKLHLQGSCFMLSLIKPQRNEHTHLVLLISMAHLCWCVGWGAEMKKENKLLSFLLRVNSCQNLVSHTS